MSTNLRKEYNEYKLNQEEIFLEAAEKWVEENIILINERLNRNAIYRLNQTLERFNRKFGPYKDKLPVIADILDKAEDSLENVITGKAGARSIASMLERMSIIYNIFSNFFGGDLAALLKTPSFRKALEKPDVRLDEINEEGHDLKEVRRVLAAALKPNKQERMLFRKVYKTIDMPTLDWNLAAKQLSNLSCAELKDLSTMPKVPMVVVDKQSNIDVGLDEVEAKKGIGGALATAGGMVAAAPVLAAGAAGKALYNRFKGPSPKDIADMTKYFNQIKNVLAKEEGPQVAKLKTGLTNLQNNIKKAASGQKFVGWNPLRNPTQLALSQAKQLIDIFETLGITWNSIKSSYSDEKLEQKDIEQLRKTFNQQINSTTNKIGRFFKGNLPKGLTAKDIVDALVAVATNNLEANANTSPQTGGENMTNQKPTSEGIRRLNNLISSLPKKNMLNENVLTMFFEIEQLELLTEDFGELDKLLTKFAQIKTNVDDSLEKMEKNVKGTVSTSTSTTAQTPKTGATGGGIGEPTNVKPPTTAQQAPAAAQQVAQEAEATAQQDPEVDAPDIATLKSSVETINKFSSNPLNIAFIDQINKVIPQYQIPGVNNVNDAFKFVNNYESILNNTENIKKAIGTILANTQQNTTLAEKRQATINQIKIIIRELLEKGGNPQPGGVQTTTNAGSQNTAPEAAPAAPSSVGAQEPPRATFENYINTGISVINGKKSIEEIIEFVKQYTAEDSQEKNNLINSLNNLIGVRDNQSGYFGQINLDQVRKIVQDQVGSLPNLIEKLMSLMTVKPKATLKPAIDIAYVDSNIIQQLKNSFNTLDKDTLQSLQAKNLLNSKVGTFNIPQVSDYDAFVKFVDNYSNILQNASNIRKLFSLINKTANVISRTKPEEKKSGSTGATAPATAPAAAPDAGNSAQTQ